MGSFEMCDGRGSNVSGRWPANVLHDGSDEVVELFPENAARFFYSPKASGTDRGHKPPRDYPLWGETDPGFTNEHPTVKPTVLLCYLLKLLSTPTGGIVLDPFMGSGSTLRAARSMGRRAIGIELEERYCEIAAERLRQEVFTFEE